MSENTNKNQKGAPDFAQEVRYMNVQMEQMSESFKFVTELVIKTNEKVDNLEVKFDNLEIKVDKLDERLSHVETTVSNIDTRLERVENEIKNKVDITVFNSLVGRVEKIEV